MGRNSRVLAAREVEYYDMPAVRKITRESATNDYRWSSIILGIVKSVPFQMSITNVVQSRDRHGAVASNYAGQATGRSNK